MARPKNDDSSGIPPIDSIAVSQDFAKADDALTITLKGVSGGRARFSIPGIPGAVDVPMVEDPSKPGVYRGDYTVEPGDDVAQTPVSAVITAPDGRIATHDSEGRITIITVPPRIDEASATHKVISNGHSFTLKVSAAKGCTVVARLSNLDTRKETITLIERPEGSGAYRARIAVSKLNTAANGVKEIQISASDPAGNLSAPAAIHIELRNPELGALPSLSSDAALALQGAGVVTLADLRRIDPGKLAEETDLAVASLERYRTAARFSAIGLGPDVADALIEGGDIGSISELLLTDPDRIVTILSDAAESGKLVPRKESIAEIAARTVGSAYAATGRALDLYRAEIWTSVNTCRSDCKDELSVLSCYAYLLELVEITGLTWAELEQRFKQDFLGVDTLPTTRIDIAIAVLEKAIREDLGNQAPRSDDWIDYERALNPLLVRILAEALDRSTSDLAKSYPNAFASGRSLDQRNRSLENILAGLNGASGYNSALVELLQERTGLAQAALEAKYPQAFDQTLTIRQRNEALEKLLGLKPVVKRVAQAKSGIAGLELKALIAQSHHTEAWLREEYCISFSQESCSGTTSCRQAILTLQEYLAKQAYIDAKYAYPTFDEWRLEQIEEHYPENVYTHEFKRSLIGGNRALLAKHLAKARSILDTVRVSVGKQRPQKDDLLSSFDWRNPYYGNLKTGIQLLQDCYDIDDLMVKGHRAYFNEEYAQARQHYLEAARKVQSTSKAVSKAMGDALLPLWAPDKKDCYFRRGPKAAAKAAKGFFDKTLLSFSEKNKPGVQLAAGQVALKGVDAQGTFTPMAKSGLNTGVWQQTDITKDMNTTPNVTVTSSGALVFKGKGEGAYATQLVYKPGAQWTDVAIEVDVKGEYILGTGFRYAGSAGWVYVQNFEFDTFQYAAFYMDGPSTHEKKEITWKGNVPYRIRVEVKGKAARATLKWWNSGSGKWEPVVSIPASASSNPISISGLPTKGTLALYANSGSDLAQPSITRLAVWDLSPSAGAVSDRAFFLKPRSSLYTSVAKSLYLIYYLRPFDLGTDPRKLASALSVTYDEYSWIVAAPEVDEDSLDPTLSRDKGFFDAFYQETGTALTGLWYDQGDARLNRTNLRDLLDGMVMLLCHQYFLLLPICLGDVANALGQFHEARQWYRLVYDERKASKQRPVYPYLRPGCEDEMLRIRHARNYLEWADFSFNQNTEESIQEARRLYILALRTMETERCCQSQSQVADYMADLGRALSPVGALQPEFAGHVFQTVANAAFKAGTFEDIKSVIGGIVEVTDGDQSVEEKAAQINSLLSERMPSVVAPPNLTQVVRNETELRQKLLTIEDGAVAVLDGMEQAFRAQKVSRLAPAVPEESGVASTGPAAATAFLEIASETDLVPVAEVNAPPAPYGSIGSESPFFVPYEAFQASDAKAKYEQIGPLVGLGSALAPEIPAGPWTIDPSQVKRALPDWVKNDLCVPRNPVIDSLTRRACLGIYHIDHCFNALGFPQEDVSFYRFEYLVAMAKNFAQMALAAEKDFIQFKNQFEKENLELMNASQAAAISQAGVQLAQLRLKEALDQVEGAYMGIEKVNAQAASIEKRIDELGSVFSVMGIIFGGAASAAASSNIGAGLLSGTGSWLSYMGGLEENEENLRMQLQVLRTAEYNAARLNLIGALSAHQSARQQSLIAGLESSFAAEKAKLLETEFFNPQLWSLLAQEVKKNYRLYLTYGTIAAWLAQRALEFERGVQPRRRFAPSGPGSPGSGVSIVRFDYFQPSQQGLLGADTLLRDIATLENEKYLHEQRKLHITKVISLAAEHPFLFARFLETGALPFATTLESFDQDYPGHYQRRIRSVRVNLTGLIGQEGIKATLSCLGSSQVVTKETVEDQGKLVSNFATTTLRHPPEAVALTNPQGGGLTKTVPLASQSSMLNPFEGQGVAAQWMFEMPKYANRIDYDTISDVQILIDYTALMDHEYYQDVLKRLSRRRRAMRAFSFRMDFPDALFHLKDAPLPLDMIETADGTTGAYTIMLETTGSDFGYNESDRKLQNVGLYIRSKNDELTSLKVRIASKSWLQSQNVNWQEADLVPASLKELDTPAANSSDYAALKPHYLGALKSSQDGITQSLTDRWYLYFSPDDNPSFLKMDGNQPLLINGHKVFDFAAIKDVIFGLNYTYIAPLPKP